MKKTYSRKKKPETSQDQVILPSKRPLVIDEEERMHFHRVVSAFRSYSSYLERKIVINIQLLGTLPEHQQTLLQNYRKQLVEAEKCVAHNQELVNLIIKDVENMFVNTNPPDINTINCQRPTIIDLEKVQITLKQFVRDWSLVGAPERNACYEPIIKEIIRNFPSTKCLSKDVKVLVPGSGLGRLAFEIAHKGYSCQGNEVSLFMLFASNFVLNRCNGVYEHSVYPWINQVDNNLSADHQLQLVRFPDVNANALLRSVRSNHFSMAAGDFLEIYDTAAEWHCIATCFFMDCAKNIVDFIEKIYHILKPDGVWINLGPLLYHFSNVPGEFSIEPPYSVVKEIVTGVGFIIEKEEIGVKTKYCQNPNSMFQHEYNSVFFVCRKPK